MKHRNSQVITNYSWRREDAFSYVVEILYLKVSWL